MKDKLEEVTTGSKSLGELLADTLWEKSVGQRHCIYDAWSSVLSSEFIGITKGRYDAVIRPEIERLSREREFFKEAIVAMVEDGWLMCGPEGMSEPQEKVYKAYMEIQGG